MAYPAAVSSFTTKTAKVDLYKAADMNAVQTDVVNIETELGTDPAGSMTDVKSRLAIMMDGYGALAQGTAFPTDPAPVAGQKFFRTDLDKEYRRNAANDAWDDVAAAINDYDDGTTYIEASGLTERSTASTTYVVLKKFSPLVRGGVVTISFDIKSSGGQTVYGRVYLNDVAAGTEQSTANTEYVTKTESITVQAGDEVEIYCKTPNNTMYIDSVYIKCLNPTTIVEVTDY